MKDSLTIRNTTCAIGTSHRFLPMVMLAFALAGEMSSTAWADPPATRAVLSLDGDWRIAFDPENKGLGDKWWRPSILMMRFYGRRRPGGSWPNFVSEAGIFPVRL